MLLYKNAESRHCRDLLSIAINIANLKSDGRLEYFRGIYLNLSSLYMEHNNIKVNFGLTVVATKWACKVCFSDILRKTQSMG